MTLDRRSLFRLTALSGAALASACTPLTLLDWITPARGASERDIAFGEDPRQRLDVYAPTGAAGPAPVMVFFYGGGWRQGERAQYRFVGEALTRLGFVAVVADYRLAPTHAFPAFVEDAASAFAWTSANIARHGGDQRRIFLMGHSAGAYNAVMVALDPRYLAAHAIERAMIAGVIGIAGPYDFLPLRGRLLSAAFGGVADPDATQPVNFGDPATPPLLLINGSADRIVSPRNAEALAARLVARGGRARAAIYDGRGHIDIMLGLSSQLDADGRLVADIQDFAASRS
jgi:acetyl esterase/lipase